MMEDLPSEAIDDTLSVQKPPGNDTNDPDETVEPSRELSQSIWNAIQHVHGLTNPETGQSIGDVLQHDSLHSDAVLLKYTKEDLVGLGILSGHATVLMTELDPFRPVPSAAAQGVNADGGDNSLDSEITQEEKRQKLLRLKATNARIEAKLQRNSSVSIWERQLSSFSYGMFKQSVPDPDVSSNDDQEIEIYGSFVVVVHVLLVAILMCIWCLILRIVTFWFIGLPLGLASWPIVCKIAEYSQVFKRFVVVHWGCLEPCSGYFRKRCGRRQRA